MTNVSFPVTLKSTLQKAYFALWSEPPGSFEFQNPDVTKCSPDVTVGIFVQDISVTYTAPKISNGTLLFSKVGIYTETLHYIKVILNYVLAISLPEIKQWSIANYRFRVRTDCYYIFPTQARNLLLTSDELSDQDVQSVLLHSPENFGLQVNFEDVIIQEDATMLIYNISESLSPIILPCKENEQISFILLEDKYLLIDIKRCSECRFRLNVKPIALEYECNSTLKMALGSLRLTKQSKNCEIQLQAPEAHRVFLKISSLLATDNCSLSKIHLGPLAGVPVQQIWTPCNTSSNAQTEFYISKSNFLRVYWMGNAESILLHYEYIPQCSNRTFAYSSVGHFCSPGYPDILFGCNVVYSIYVPFGYSIELKLSLLGITTGAFCQNSSLEVSTRNSSGEEKLLLGLCFSTTNDDTDFLTLHTPKNSIDIRVRAGNEWFQRGFCAEYKAILKDPEYANDCPYGWVSSQKFCYKIFEERLGWIEAEEACQLRNGHLASITDNRVAALIDNIIMSSPFYKRGGAFWIGANDLQYENCYEWTDGQPFEFIYWFPGWDKYEWYGVQPSDDGLSEQDCVEMRNSFRYPSKGEGITDRFYWNDRDCHVANPYVCQRLKPGENLEPVVFEKCNRTITLSWKNPREVLTSPAFPNRYPNNIECHYHIIAPKDQKIVALFTDFVLEESQSCEYDVLTIIEEDKRWHHCGNWESKIKLLRHIYPRNYLYMTFSTDFSHSFKGFRVEFSLLEEKSGQDMVCDNDMFHLKGRNCYLVVNYPETSWATARQICSEAKAKLAIVENAEQITILDELVRATYGYISGIIYWVGAKAPVNGDTWEWLDGTRVNSKHLSISRNEDILNPSCLAIQWKQLRNTNALRWTAKNCNHPGRFICQKPSVVIPDELNKTVSQLSGNLTSVNYPSNYLNNLDYIVEIIGPPNSRVVLVFHHFELEWQEDCLYDYLLLQNDLKKEGLRLCGEQLSQKEFMSTGNSAYMSFHSDFSTVSSGYKASWEIVDLSVCFNRRLLILEATHISSLRYPRSYLTDMECRLTVIASEVTKRLLVTITDFDLRSCEEDYLEVNLDPTDEVKLKLCVDDVILGTQLLAYGHEAQFLFSAASINTMISLEKRGYNLTCETWDGTALETTLYLKSKRKGRIYGLNFNQSQPIGLNYTRKVVVPVGYKIHLFSLNMKSSQLATSCEGSGLLIRDTYAKHPTLFHWTPCRSTDLEADGLWSTLHVLEIDAWNFDGSLPLYYLDYAVVKDEHFVNTTLTLISGKVDSCLPNPCQHGGRCIRNGTNHKCHCFGQYTGLFCHVTWCDINICGENGTCNLTSSGWICDCFSGFGGSRCQNRITPCSPDPCGDYGKCIIQNGTFFCQCEQDFEGPNCEKLVMRIPFKPLSERMLQEPFWLGLITVFSVLVIILFVYCIKRKFADKIEKFLAAEIERSKYQPSPPATRYSLSSTQATPGSQSPQTCPKSLLQRIRKNSLLSNNCSPSPTPDRDTSRTFSFDDILRRVHSSKRNKASSSSPSASNTGANQAELSKEEIVKKEEEKSRILASLVTPVKESASRRMSLDEFFRMSERKLQIATRRTNSTDTEGREQETSFISMPSPKTLRQSFTDIQSIREQSFEYISSSDSLSGEPYTSEVQADVSPTPPAHLINPGDEVDKSPESNASHSATTSPTPSQRAHPISVSITVDKCDSDNKPDSEPEDKNCDSETKNSDCGQFTALSSIISQNSSYLEVPKTIPAIQVISAESEDPHNANESPNFMKDISENSSPYRKDFTQQRKYSVDLPMPKILITTNMNSCDSDEASPPRTPNPNKSMMYLSPLAVISSSTDRTISESNLSTSGYSSISSPGLSRCNSSSPISDDVEHHHHSNCTHKPELHSPKKPHGMQMTYLSVGGNDKSFFFPQTITCHCHTPNQPSPVIFEPKNSPTISTVWSPGKHRLLCKRNSYQTTSTDDSIDDEGIGMDTGELRAQKVELRGTFDVDMHGTSEQISKQLISSPLLLEPCKPDLLACSVNNKTGNGGNFKGSPRIGMRKSDKNKKFGDKHRRSPVLSPAGTPIKDLQESPENRIPRNSSRTSMSGPLVSSSESEDSECYMGARQKSRRSKKHDTNKQCLPSQESSGLKEEQNPHSTGRSSPPSESNGDSAPMDSRSQASSSSESLSSTAEKVAGTVLDITGYMYLGCVIPLSGSSHNITSVCNRHKSVLEHTRSFPPLSQWLSRNDEDLPKIKIDYKAKIKSPVPQIGTDEELNRSSEDHPYLRRQEAVEEDPSDDSSSETTVLLGRQTPRNMQQSSSAEWEAFAKE
ncbi:hypothetical protein CDAR_256572 [Caerostris darwini]|uniref:Uncharacterized protein n=1 Tax=Caerostris darwini TaxID=1538125 RepID=A0AAV4PGF8_9ARAC|nr:hypothetical protein CDAR_256572 [Caerostris darwini]